MPAHSRFWGSQGACPPPDLIVEQVFDNARGFVLGDYLPDLLGFGLPAIRSGFCGLLVTFGGYLWGLAWVVGFRPFGRGRAYLTLPPIHETILLSGRANASNDRK